MSSFDLGVILRVVTSPNAAFVQVRDNEEQYFAQSIALLIISSILSGFAVLPFIIMPLDEAYFEFEGSEDLETTFPMGDSAIALTIVSGIVSGFVSAILYYFIGKKLDGNTNWKKVFAVVFHVHVVVILITIVMAIVLFLMWESFTSIEPSVILDPTIDDEDIFLVLSSFIGYVLLLIVLGIGFVVWGLIVSIKAIKTVHGFGTGKAFGLILLVGLITSLVSIPFSYS